ncbi:dehydrogenase [Ktedonobacter sp. SOSP1-85]|uniref:Gfo/Idh/MocA family protein n=1 Tax=Ktedonobacter sp. SOSP1-85 TaxID=2778367 RepID=UPI001914DCCB|nr:Gfo/Idh/MocA family oxidoreductase [Ktedonobacter sp. SOSP1-85]GHO81566.1 dehydrogenase [Ktedonobacter sp. SOSP1-85]
MPLRIIQVGVGGWGHSWTKLVLNNDLDVELVACVDMSEKALQRVQEDYTLPAQACFTDLKEALKGVDCDAVLVTAGLNAHVPLARIALEHNKHVLVEKPFAPTLEEADSLVKLARERGVHLMVSQNYRFQPTVAAVDALLQEGALGEISTINIDFRRYVNVPRDAYIYYRAWQPLLVDMAVHHFDLMRKLLKQKPQRITCHAWNTSWDQFDDPSSATATIEFSGGAVVNYRGSWASTSPQTPWNGEWRIECHNGSIEWTGRGDKPADDRATVYTIGEEGASLALPEVPYLDRLGSLATFIQSIESDTEAECSGRDNLGTLALMFAAVKAAQTGTPQSILLPQE